MPQPRQLDVSAPQRLPLFPLPNVVLFPGMLLPLHIFEPRYRQMMQDVIAGNQRFGVQLCQEYNPATLQGKPFDVGTVAKLVDYETLPDGRMNILTMGERRFRVTAYDSEEKPYLQGDVVWLEDIKEGYITKKLVAETSELFLEALRLTCKIYGKDYKPFDLPSDPQELSFVVAENLRGSLVLKQELLEMDATKTRLQYEREVLQRMVKSLAVRTQIEDVFKNT